MKKIILILALMSLEGCALLDAYFLKYDTNEYNLITDIRTSALVFKNKCENLAESKLHAEVIAVKTKNFVNFTEYQPHNKNVQAASVELDKIAQGLLDQYQKNEKVSSVFCKVKFETLERSAETIQKTVGAKPR